MKRIGGCSTVTLRCRSPLFDAKSLIGEARYREGKLFWLLMFLEGEDKRLHSI